MSESFKALVCRLDLWINPIFDQTLAPNPNVHLDIAPSAPTSLATQESLAGAHVYHVCAAKDDLPKRWWVSSELINACPNLLCVSAGGAGYDTVDVDACTKAGIPVVNQAGANAHSVAEHTFALLLALIKRVVESDRMLRTESGFRREDLMGDEIHGCTIGLVGIGEIGARTAKIAAGFGLNVLAYDPYVDDEEIRARGAEPVSLEALLHRSDFVSLHCPLTSETRHMIGADQFAKMKPGSVFVSTARGGIHDETALYEALKSGRLRGAGLDVWEVEPPPHEAPLLSLANVVATFHTAGVSHGGRRNVARSSAEQILMMLDGVRPPHLLNPEVWDRFLTRREQILGLATKLEPV